MSSTDKLAGLFTEKFEDIDHIKQQFSGGLGGTATRFEYFQDTLKLQDSGLRIYKETVTGDVAIWNFHSWNDSIALWGPGTAFTAKEQVGPSGLQI